MSDSKQTAGEYLAWMMNRLGTNPNALAMATDGAVSPTTIRSYVAGGNVSRSKLAAVARAVGEPHGSQLLKSYGFEDLADAVAEEATRQALADDHGPAEYRPPTLSAASRQLLNAFAEFLQALEAGEVIHPPK